MKKHILLILLLFSAIVVNAQFIEDFSSLSSSWSGDKSKFVVDSRYNHIKIEDPYQSGGASSYLSRKSSLDLTGDCEWVFNFDFYELPNFERYMKLYLATNKGDLKSSLNGYYLLIGGDDCSVSLFYQNGVENYLLIKGEANRINNKDIFLVTVKKSKSNEWTLTTENYYTSVAFSEGVANHQPPFKSTYAGFVMFYPMYYPTKPDQYVLSCFHVIGGSGSSDGSDPDPEPDTEEQIYGDKAANNEVIFSEIMADPDPPIGTLPNAEYIELYNRTDREIDISGWKLYVGNLVATVALGVIEPHGYIILCAEKDFESFIDFDNVALVESFRALNNSGKLLVLKDVEDNVVSWVDYTDKWFTYCGEANKKSGGWSLERVDINNLLNDISNWMPTINLNGGTPASVNSVDRNNPELLSPEVNYISMISPDTIEVTFSKTMDFNTLTDLNNWISNVDISSVLPIFPKLESALLVLNRNLEIGESFELRISGLKSVNGNSLEDKIYTISSAEKASVGDLVINEILFRPSDEGVQYVELFNNSEFPIDLSKISIARRRDETLDNPIKVSLKPAILMPKSYVVLSPLSYWVKNKYSYGDNSFWIDMTLPSILYKEGALVLISEGDVIDDIYYNEKYHHGSLESLINVSLERVDPSKSGLLSDNWISSSTESGYGTPGYSNSKHVSDEVNQSDGSFWLEKRSFTPDNDGYEDRLVVGYNLPQDNYLLTARIFNADGILIKELSNNLLIEKSGYFYWDGTNTKDKIASVGIYVLFIQAIHQSGDSKKAKIACVLTIK